MFKKRIHKKWRLCETVVGTEPGRCPPGHGVTHPDGPAHLDVVAPVLQQDLLAALHAAEQLVHLSEVGHSVLIQQVLQP